MEGFKFISESLRKEEPRQENFVEQTQNQVLRPLAYKDVVQVADLMIKGETVKMILDELIKTEQGIKDAKRIIDYLSGVSYVLGYKIIRQDNITFIFSK